MSRSTKQSWLEGPGDLKEDEVKDVPVKGQSVKIRALSATAASAASSEAVSSYEERGIQKMKIDQVKLSQLRFQAGVVDPEFSLDEVKVVFAKYGPAVQRVLTAINELSGIDEETVVETEARFQGSGTSAAEANGTGAAEGNGGPTVPARAGAGAGDAG